MTIANPKYPVRTLPEAIRVLDPDHALDLNNPDELGLFVDRQADAIAEVVTLLEHGSHNTKIIFSGHRGNGKSTELSRVESELPDHWIIRFSVRERLNIADLKASDIVLMTIIQMLAETKKRHIPISRNLDGRIQQLGKEITREIEISEGASLGVSAKITESFFSFFGLEGKLSKETVTREKVRENVGPLLSDMADLVERLAEEMEQLHGKKPVIIIEDLDKGTIAQQKEIFTEYGAILSDMLPVRVVFTFPLALRNQRQDDIFAPVMLPNFKVNERDGKPCQSGRSIMTGVITKRVAPSIIDADALNTLVCHSGGIPRILLRLARDAAVRAVTRRRRDPNSVDSITPADVEHVLNKERQNYQRILTDEQISVLQNIAETRHVDKGNPVHLELLDNLSILEYQNGNLWYEVNPVVLPLLNLGGKQMSEVVFPVSN